MKFKKLFALLLATGMALMVACGSGNSAAGTQNNAAETAENKQDDKQSSDNQDAGKENDNKDEADGPVILEHFENRSKLAIARGSVDFNIVEDGYDGTKALCISNRTDTWNGANFDCKQFRGNTIRVNAYVKSTAKSVRASIQFDVDGITAYNWIASADTNADSYTLLTGTYTIPDDVDKIYVYFESDTTDDIYLDEVEIKADGKYTEPAPLKVEEKQMADTSEYASMKEVYADYFDIGVCINPTVISNENYSSLILKEFNSVTLENNLKPEGILSKSKSLEDLEGGGTHLALDMSGVTAELDFAVENHLKVRGHTLIWHSQTPDWIFYVDYDTSGELADRELMLQRVDNYMKDVFTWAEENYDGLFYAWDIVNEAMGDNNVIRDSLWYQTIGDDYIEQVFAIARKYAPEDIKLFYNDYNSFQNGKQDAILEMLRPVAEAGNIDGVGMQGHLYTAEEPEHFVNAAKRYADELGVIIHITEIDVMQPSSGNPEGDQGAYYGKLFKALKEAKKEGVPIESVSIWGLSDSLSWKAGDKPLLFNSDLSGKNAFYEVIQAARDE